MFMFFVYSGDRTMPKLVDKKVKIVVMGNFFGKA